MGLQRQERAVAGRSRQDRRLGARGRVTAKPGDKTTTNISGGWTIAINAKAPDPANAFKVLTAIFDKKNFLDWTVPDHRMAVRSDIATDPAYTADPFLAKATELAKDTTGRDTVPGYAKVSALVQQATAEILDGKSVDDVGQGIPRRPRRRVRRGQGRDDQVISPPRRPRLDGARGSTTVPMLPSSSRRAPLRQVRTMASRQVRG